MSRIDDDNDNNDDEPEGRARRTTAKEQEEDRCALLLMWSGTIMASPQIKDLLRRFFLLLVVVLLQASEQRVQACSLCVALPLPAARAAARHPSRLALTAVTQVATRRPVLAVATLVAHRLLQEHRAARNMRTQQQRRRWLAAADEPVPADGEETVEAPAEREKAPLTTAMVTSIGFYKNFISPLLPPACRFLPTCSRYGVQAIEEFGPCQGGVLTAWRTCRTVNSLYRFFRVVCVIVIPIETNPLYTSLPF